MPLYIARLLVRVVLDLVDARGFGNVSGKELQELRNFADKG